MSETLWPKNKLIFYLLIIGSAGGYYWLCYQTKRENFSMVFGLYSSLFTAYYLLYRFFSDGYFKYLLIAGISFRLLFFSMPPQNMQWTFVCHLNVHTGFRCS